MTGRRPTAMKSHARAVAVTPPDRRVVRAKTSRVRLRSAKMMPKPRTHSLVVPIQPRGKGTVSSAATAATGTSSRSRNPAARAAFTTLLTRVALEPFRLDFLGFLLVLLAQQPLAPLVQVVGLEPFLLRHRGHVAILAVLRWEARVLGLLDQLGSGGGREC